MSELSNIYLFSYNTLQASGWVISLFRILINYLSTNSVSGTYASAGEVVCFWQILAFLEVIHGAIGIVPSGTLQPFMQWGGRSHVLLAVIRSINEVQEYPSVFVILLAWSLIEVIRYPFYALSCIGKCPNFLTYLRYTAFIVLYPMGLTSEMYLMYQALPFIKKKNLYADLFYGLPFSYYSFVRVLLVCYPFLWLKLYLHLFKQRQSRLGKRSNKKRN